jgi:hypothetical protein
MNQEIMLPASELKAALPGLSKIVGKSKTLPVLTAARIARDHQGRVSLQATNLDSRTPPIACGICCGFQGFSPL